MYNLALIAQNYLERLLHLIVGGHEGQFWVRWEPVFSRVQDALVEPVRLCLLAVAFRRCLEIFVQRSTVRPGAAARPESTLPVLAGGGRHVMFPIRFPSSELAGVLAAIALVAVSAVGLRLSDPRGTVDMVSGVPGKPVTINDGELSVDRVRVGTVLTQNDEVR